MVEMVTNRLIRIGLVAICVGVSGCAGSNIWMQNIIASGALTIQPSQSPNYDFLVSLRNGKDFGFDPDNKVTRDQTALAALREQCPDAHIVGETVINTGTYLLGNPARTYSMQVKCA